MTSASHCVEPQNDSPHLQRWEPHSANPRRIKGCNGTVRRGKCPSSPRRALAHSGTTRTRLDDHKPQTHIHISGRGFEALSLHLPFLPLSRPSLPTFCKWPPYLPHSAASVTAALLEANGGHADSSAIQRSHHALFPSPILGQPSLHLENRPDGSSLPQAWLICRQTPRLQ